jgi:hypothetical protein
MYILEIISVIVAVIAISKANSAEKRVEYLANKIDVAAKALGDRTSSCLCSGLF